MTLYKLLLKIYKYLPAKKIICYVLKLLPNNDKFYKDLIFDNWFIISVEKKKLYLFQYKGSLENEIFWKGIHHYNDNVTLALWLNLCKIANSIFDIGANTGIYAMTAKCINPTSNVFAFEPSKNIYHKLQKHIKKNNFDIISNDLAFSNNEGEFIFYDTEEGGHPLSASLSSEKLKNFKGYHGQIVEYTVQTTTVDIYIQKNKLTSVDLVKIDVELHESEVIEGMKNCISAYKPFIIIEILTLEIATRVQELFKQEEYLFFSIENGKQLKKVELIVLNETYNYFFCPKQKQDMLDNLAKSFTFIE